MIIKMEKERDSTYDFYVNLQPPCIIDRRIPFVSEEVYKFQSNATSVMNRKVDAIDKIIYALHDLLNEKEK